MVKQRLGQFVSHASPFGVPLVVLHPDSPARQEVHAFAQTSAVHVIYSEREQVLGRYNPAYMVNSGLFESARKGHEYFAIVSSDLAHHIPKVMPEMVRRLDMDPELATVGVAIDTVHDMSLLNQVRRNGMRVVNPDNFVTVIPNNAFSLHRARPGANGLTQEDFRFDELFEDRLGYTDIGGRQVELRYNEELERMLRAIKNSHPLNMLLLAGKYTLQRTPGKPDSASPYKRERRQAVADSYRRQADYAVSDRNLSRYLQNHYQIEFGAAA